MPLREDPRVVAERDRKLLQNRIQAVERKAGMPSPRVRQASAGPLVARRGPDEREVRTIQVWHRIPAYDASHSMSVGCWCAPAESRDADGARWHTHNVLAAAEKPDDSAITATHDMLSNRER